MALGFEKDDKVAVVGGTLDSTGVIETYVTICTIIAVGESDLLVRPDRATTAPPQIVPKSICTPIPFTSDAFQTKRALPSLGDMVYYYGKLNWRDSEETTLIGTVYEIKYRDGSPFSARVHTGSDMVDLPCGDLLVLQKKPS